MGHANGTEKTPDLKRDGMGSSGGMRPMVPQIKALRVAAMAGIFLHHLWKGIYGSVAESGSGLFHPFAILLDLGALGVVFFNILSGFVLALPFFQQGDTPEPGYGDFLTKRFRRLLPHYYTVIFVFTITNIWVFHINLTPAFLTFMKLAFFAQSFDYNILMGNFAAYWYMAMLVQFHFLYPPLLHVFRRMPPLRAFLTTALLCYGACILLHHHVLAHPDSPLATLDFLITFNIPSRLPEFAFGMWMAAAWRPLAPRCLGMPFDPAFTGFICCLLAPVLAGIAWPSLMSPPIAFIHEVMSCYLVVPVLFALPIASSLGRRQSISRLAAASFSFYLLHQPLLSYAGALTGTEAGRLTRFILIAAIMAPITYGAARLLDTFMIPLRK